jgi:hypothetical protein
MKKQFSLILLSFFVVIILCSCDQEQLQTTELKEYFRTNDITANVDNSILNVKVENSNLVEEKRRLQGARWLSAEPITSVGAVIALGIVDQMDASKIDSMVLNVELDNKFNRYAYSFRQLQEVKNYFETCKKFGKVVTKENYEDIAHYLGNKIVKANSSEQVKMFLDKIFLRQQITKTDLIGFKIGNDNTVTLYIDYYYPSGPQTYALSFDFNTDDKISGIAIIQ